MRILVADDDRVISQLVCAIVRKGGHTPLAAFDAMQAMMFAMRSPSPDLIILDISMPGGTGVEALKKLKLSARTSEIPIVVLSGSDDLEMPARVLELGALAYLGKPIDPEVLSEAIRAALAA